MDSVYFRKLLNDRGYGPPVKRKLRSTPAIRRYHELKQFSLLRFHIDVSLLVFVNNLANASANDLNKSWERVLIDTD
jgi:hypothetical protein